MLAILHHIFKFLLSALERYSPVRLLQYLLALCRTMDFSRSKSKCSGQGSSHEFLPKPLILAEEKESLSEEGIVNPVGHVISACRTPGELEEGPAQMAEIFPSCVYHQLLLIVYEQLHYPLAQGTADAKILSERMSGLKVTRHSKKAYFGACGPTVRVCFTRRTCSIILDPSGVPLLKPKSRSRYGLLILRRGNLLTRSSSVPRLIPEAKTNIKYGPPMSRNGASSLRHTLMTYNKLAC